MKKATAKNINLQALREILDNFEDEEHIDFEVFEFEDGSPAKIIIRSSKDDGPSIEDKETGEHSEDLLFKSRNVSKSTEKSEDKYINRQDSDSFDDTVQNPTISETIEYKDLLDNLI